MKVDTVQSLLKNPVAISSFATDLAAIPALPEYDQTTVTQFMEKLNAFLSILRDSHPHKTMQKHSIIDKFFGYDLVSDSRYILAVRKRTKALQDLMDSVSGLKNTYAAIRDARYGLTERKDALKNTIEQTRRILETMRGTLLDSEIESVERLSKRLVDLSSVVLVMELHETQSALIDTQLLSALDLFYRLQDKFLPILEQHEKAIKENPKSSKKMYKEFTNYVAAFGKTNANLMH